MAPSNLVIAGFSVAIECSDEAITSYLQRELQPFLGGNGTDMVLSLTLGWADTVEAPDFADGRIHVTLPTGQQLCLEQESVDGSIVLNVTAGILPEDDRGSLAYLHDFLINYIFSLVIQQLQAEGKAHMFLVHACGIIHDQRGYLFAGVSGKGKTTVARQLALAGKHLLGDDMILVSRNLDGWMVHGSPMGGEVPRANLANCTVPLEAVFLIEQEDETGWREVSMGEATAALIGLVVPSYPLIRVAPKQLSDYNHETTEILLEEAALLAGDIPCYKLGLSLNDPPWEHIFDQAGKREAERQ